MEDYFPFPLPQPLPPTIPLSVSTKLTSLGTSYQLNQTVLVFL